MIRKLKLISNCMSSSTGKQTITIHTLSNVLRSKGNQTMKSGQLIEYKVRNIFFKKHAEIEAKKLVPDQFFFKKVLYKVNTSGLHVCFNIFW